MDDINRQLDAYKKEICNKCRGKGYATHFYGIQGEADFKASEAWTEPRRIHITYCDCQRGQQLEKVVVTLQQEAKLELLKKVFKNMQRRGKRDHIERFHLLTIADILQGYWKSIQKEYRKGTASE